MCQSEVHKFSRANNMQATGKEQEDLQHQRLTKYVARPAISTICPYIGPTGTSDNAELDVLSWLLNNIFQYQKSDYLHLHQSRDRPKFVFVVGVENDCF